MPVHLLDVNVLLALAWPNHAHHNAAHDWFTLKAPAGWSTCPLTQCGFVRLSSNPRAVAGAVSPFHAVQALRRFANYPNHTFWPDDIDWTRDADIDAARLTGHKQVTDAYLVALAVRHIGRLATFGRGVSTLVTPGINDLVVQIPN